jgi:hypothetical protein
MEEKPSAPVLLVVQTKLTGVLLGATFVLIIGNILGLISTFSFGHPNVFGLVRLFNLNDEANIPTYFASMLHLVAAALLALAAASSKHQGSKDHRKWLLLALVFVCSSIDEAAQVHELAMAPVRQLTGASGLLFFSWVIPAFVVLAVLGGYLLPFLFRLPAKTRNLFFLAAFLFLGGAMGVEMPEGAWFQLHGKENIFYFVMTTVEESLEMFGLICFIHALTGYLADHAPVQYVCFTRNNRANEN